MSRPTILSPSRWNRPLVLMLLLLCSEAQLVALAGNDGPVPAATVDTSFQCHAETSGTRDFPAPGGAGAGAALDTPCFYRLYATRCNTPITHGDVTRQECGTAPLVEFALHAGETMTVKALPAGYRFCVSLQAAPTLEECMRNPSPQ